MSIKKPTADSSMDETRKSIENPPIITQFVLGENLFQSDGFSIIKVTKAGKSVNFSVPIKSIGIVELRERLEVDAPKPPRKLRKVLKGSELAKELGIEKDTHVEVFDFTEVTYLEKSKEFRTSMFWQIVIMAINAEFVEKDSGVVITDMDKKKEALMNSGITAQHLDQILMDVMRLTSDAEGTADFLSANAWA